MLSETRRSPVSPVFVVDAGDLLWKSAQVAEAMRPQQEVKADLIARAFAAQGIDALTPGEGDLAFGLDFYQDLARRYELPVVAANLRCGGSAPFQAARRVERGGVSLGVTGVIDPGLVKGGCEATEPVAAAREAIAGLGPVDVVVVLSHQERDADQALAEAIAEVDLVVNGHARLTHDTPRALPGAALQLAAGSRSRNVGVATLTLLPGASGFSSGDAVGEAEERLKRARARLDALRDRIDKAKPPLNERLERQRDLYTREVERAEADLAAAKAEKKTAAHRLVNELKVLDEDVADHPETVALLDQAKDAMARLERGSPVATDEGPRAYMGAETCKGCHPAPYAQWADTPHAGAWATLEGVNRAMDRECFSCHATGVGEPGGPSAPSTVGGLGDVQCEACHGPGREHLAAPTKVDMLAKPSVETCVGCHDGVKDEGRFDAATYLPKVAHADAAPSKP